MKYILCIMVLFCTSAIAITVAVKDGKTVVTVTREDCENIVTDATYHAEEDVAYKPDEDVDGVPVTPADVPHKPEFSIPEILTIPLELNLRNRGIRMVPFLGTIDIHSNGQVAYNGEPLRPDLQEHIKTICRKNYNM